MGVEDCPCCLTAFTWPEKVPHYSDNWVEAVAPRCLLLASTKENS